ncbi:MAG: phosphoadenosine phosphosulfate reductase [Sphingomonadales bacterium]|nr:phosphoadenosine phosphosulfate reductase [Sphingomonadales bacterium]
MADADFLRVNAAATALAALGHTAPASVAERLLALVESISGRLVLTTSFGMEAQLIAHHIFTKRLPIEVATIDTGRLFPETHRVWQETEERYGVRIRAVHPEASEVTELISDQGINGFYHSKDARFACCDVRKVHPLNTALDGASAWIVGLRADQSRHRSSVRLASWDSHHQLVKLAPLFDWTRDEVAAECAALGVPVNGLHAAGFHSIGCAPCTRAVQPGEDERAGRWWWEAGDTKECGLHLGGRKAA